MKRPVALLLVLIVCFHVFALNDTDDYKVLVYSNEEALSSFSQTFFKAKPFDLNVFKHRDIDSERNEARVLGEALAKAYSSEDPAAIEEARKKYDEFVAYDNDDPEWDAVSEGPFNVSFVDVPGSLDGLDLVQAVAEDDVFTLDLACYLSGCDMLVVQVENVIGGFGHSALYIYQAAYGSVELVYETLSMEGDGSFPDKALLSLASYFFEHPVSIVVFEGIPEGSSIIIDGSPSPMMAGRILVPSGEHVFEISRQGYTTRRFKAVVPNDEVCTIATALEVLEYDAVQVDSNPKSEVFYEGRSIGMTPLVLEGYTIPLVLRFSADGYTNRTVSLESPTEGLFVQLKPEWMDDSSLYEKARDDFYSSFAGSLMVFGLGIVVNSLGSDGGLFYEIAGIALEGVLAFSLTNLVSNLMEYYRCSEYISP